MILPQKYRTGIVCFFDGACEPTNPGGNMGIGAVIYMDGELVKSLSQFIPAEQKNSNNVAEYLAFEWILKTLKELGYNERFIQIYGDSMLVVSQMQGKWRIKNGYYLEYAHRCKELMQDFKNTLIQWIPRDENYYADDLSKGEMVKNNVEFKIQNV